MSQFERSTYKYALIGEVRQALIDPYLVLQSTGWTTVNLSYFPDSIEIASLEGLTLWCSEINHQHGYWLVMYDFMA